MKRTSTFKHIAALGIIAVMILSGCGVAVQDHHNRPNRGYSHNHRRNYDYRLDNNGRRINEYKQTKYRDEVLVIEVRHNNLKRKLDEFKGNTKHEWHSFKQDFNHDMKEMNKSLKRFPKRDRNR